MMKLFNAVFAVLIAASMTGCATRLMKASPFYTGTVVMGKTSSGKMVRWDDPEAVKIDEVTLHETRKLDRDRVNVWPFFYQNFLVSSIFWPIGEINDVGWELRPLASIDNYEKDYRVLLYGWNAKRGSHYLLPVYVSNEDSFYSLPLSWVGGDADKRWYNVSLLGGYGTEDGSSFVFPLYGWEGATSSLYSLLVVSEYGGEEVYVMPPLYIKDGADHSLLWPLGKLQIDEKESEDGVMRSVRSVRFFPLFSYSDYGNKATVLPPLYVKEPDQHHVLWPLGRIGFRKTGVENEKELEDLYFFPLAGYLNGGEALYLGGPLFIRYTEGKNTDNFVAWPLFNLRTSEREGSPAVQGHFLNLYAHYKEKDYSNTAALFPFCIWGFDKRYERDMTWRVFFPFYSASDSKTGSIRNYMGLAGTRRKQINGEFYDGGYVLPFYGHWWSTQTRLVAKSGLEEGSERQLDKATPEVQQRYDRIVSAKEHTFMFPNIYFSASPELDSEAFSVFPLMFYSREGSRHKYNVLLDVFEWKEDAKESSLDTSFMWFLFRYSSSPRAVSTFLFPFFYHSQRLEQEGEVWAFLPFYLSGSKQKSNWSYVFPSFYRSVDEEFGQNTNSLLPFYHYQSSEGRNSLWTPVWQQSEDEVQEVSRRQLFHYIYYNEYRKGVSDETYVFPSYYTYKNERTSESIHNFFPFIFSSSNPDIDSFGSFLWFYTRRYDHKQLELNEQALWFLYYHKRQDEIADKRELYTSTRVLWKLYHREQKGQEVNIDVFPFVSYTSSTELSRFSFAWHLFSFEREQEKSTMHLFFIPLTW